MGICSAVPVAVVVGIDVVPAQPASANVVTTSAPTRAARRSSREGA